MPETTIVRKAKKKLRQGKRPSTAAGEFVHEEIQHVRQGKHGARSAKQAIAIGLSKARRAGVPLPPPGARQAKEETRKSAARDVETGQKKRTPRRASSKRSKATLQALKREPRTTASTRALSKQARGAATRRRRRASSRSTRAGR
jgi:Family of unknown function (DUF6496)